MQGHWSFFLSQPDISVYALRVYALCAKHLYFLPTFGCLDCVIDSCMCLQQVQQIQATILTCRVNVCKRRCCCVFCFMACVGMAQDRKRTRKLSRWPGGCIPKTKPHMLCGWRALKYTYAHTHLHQQVGSCNSLRIHRQHTLPGRWLH